jgi:chromosome segregation ATPase
VYRSGVRKSEQQEAALNEELQRLLMQEQAFSERLGVLKANHDRVSSERDQLEKTLESEREKAGSSEAELFDEIVQLDEKLTQNLQLQQQQEQEIKALSEKISAYEADRNKTRSSKGRETDLLAKRFTALYKNITVHDRALEGFSALTEDMKIKCEEVVHRLNEAPDQVTVKRKVFSGKGHGTVLEVLFSYNGRLYFRRNREHQIELLTVGNKNTQTRDLEFIDKISRKG